MADKRISDNPPVYVIKASLVQWLIFGSIMYAIMSMSAMKEQFAVDMEVQQRLSKLKELRVSFDESNKLTETMCKP
jgi:hypothetical protein